MTGGMWAAYRDLHDLCEELFVREDRQRRLARLRRARWFGWRRSYKRRRSRWLGWLFLATPGEKATWLLSFATVLNAYLVLSVVYFLAGTGFDPRPFVVVLPLSLLLHFVAFHVREPRENERRHRSLEPRAFWPVIVYLSLPFALTCVISLVSAVVRTGS
jgi:hypothetical protein